jgi:hypothetical protein
MSQETALDKLIKNTTTSLSHKRVEDPTSTRILMLISTTSGSRQQLSQQERSIAMLEALEIPFETLNCAMPEYLEQRDHFFDMSGVRGDFPQFFLISPQAEAGKTEVYLGQYPDIERINELSNLPKSALKDTDVTWDSIMGTTNRYNHKGVSVGEIDNDDDNESVGSGGLYADL